MIRTIGTLQEELERIDNYPDIAPKFKVYIKRIRRNVLMGNYGKTISIPERDDESFLNDDGSLNRDLFKPRKGRPPNDTWKIHVVRHLVNNWNFLYPDAPAKPYFKDIEGIEAGNDFTKYCLTTLGDLFPEIYPAAARALLKEYREAFGYKKAASTIKLPCS